MPDLRGHGQSISNKLENYFEDTAQDLVDTLNHLEIDSAHIVGCSLGGIVSVFFAKRFPDKIKTLTISGVISKKPDNWTEMHTADVKHQTELLQSKETVAFFDSMHKSDWKQMLYMVRDPEWYPFDETKDLDALNMPILIMVGEGKPDEVKTAMIYPETNMNVHVSIIPFTGHLVHDEQPEVYTKVLEVFLNRVVEIK